MSNDRTTKSQNRLRRLTLEGAWIVIGQALAVSGFLIGIRLLTELLDPETYGQLALWITLATLLNQIVFAPLSHGVTRFFAPAFENGNQSAYLAGVYRLVRTASGFLLSATLVVVLGTMIAGRLDLAAAVAATLAYAIVAGYNSTLSGVQTGARQRAIVAMHQGIEPWMRFLFAGVLIKLLGPDVPVVILGFVVGASLVLASQLNKFRAFLVDHSPAPDPDDKWTREMVAYSWPFAVWGIFTWAQSASERWALELFVSTGDVGMSAVLFQLGYQPMSMASGMATQFLSPIFYQRAGNATSAERNAGVTKLAWRLTSMTLLLAFALSGVAFLLHQTIFSLLVAPEYARVSYLLPWVMLSGGIFAAGQTISLNLMSQLRTKQMLAAKVGTAVIGIVAAFAGAYTSGIPGIVAASLTFSVSYLIWISMASHSRNASHGDVIQPASRHLA